MSGFRVLDSAAARIDDIYDYTLTTWGEAQARADIEGLFEHFAEVSARGIPWRPIPKDFGVEGHFTRYERHLIFHKVLSDGTIGIAAILHERMDVAGRIHSEFNP